MHEQQNAGNAASAEVMIAFWRLLVLLHLEASYTLCFAGVASHDQQEGSLLTPIDFQQGTSCCLCG